MEKIKLMIDGSSDITKELAQELDINVRYLKISIDDKEFVEGTYTSKEYYKMLNECVKMPTTSAVTQFEFLDEFNDFYKDEYTHVIVCTLYSKGSSTNDNAHVAKKMFFEENPEAEGKIVITVIDSKAYSLLSGYPVIECARRIKKNEMNYEQAVEFILDWYECVEAYVGLYTLKFAKKSGRIHGAAAFIGEVLGMRPIMKLCDGIFTTEDKVRGDKNVVPRLIECVKKNRSESCEYGILRGESDEPIEQLEAELTALFGCPPYIIADVGAAVASNAGPRLAAVFFKGKKRL